MQSIRRLTVNTATLLESLASLPWTAPLPRR
jgi:hypothetical protein